MQIYTCEIPYINPCSLLSALPQDKNIVFLDSSAELSRNNRYSCIAYDPFSLITLSEGQLQVDGTVINQSPLQVLSDILKKYTCQPTGLPFSGGIFGYIGYEFFRTLEPKIN